MDEQKIDVVIAKDAAGFYFDGTTFYGGVDDTDDYYFKVYAFENPSVILNLSVYDSDTGGLVESADVTVGNRVKQTNSNGDALFPDLSGGQYEIEIYASGYEPYHTTINLGSSGTTVVCFGLIPAASSPSNKPVIIDVTSYYSNRNKQSLFLDGVDCNLTFAANVNWNGKTPDKFRFITPDNTIEETTGNHTFNMGQDFGPSGCLTVVAVSQDGTESDPFDANIEVMSLPPAMLIPPALIYGNNNFSYQGTLKIGIIEPTGKDVPKDIPIFGEKQISFNYGSGSLSDNIYMAMYGPNLNIWGVRA